MSEQRTAIETVAMTLYGEARGQSLLDRLAVGAVIRERVLRPGWWGKLAGRLYSAVAVYVLALARRRTPAQSRAHG